MLQNLAVSDSGFLFDARTGRTFSLSPTGTFLLRALIGGTPPDGLPGQLMSAFDLDANLAERDAEQFLLRLRDLRIFGHEEGRGRRPPRVGRDGRADAAGPRWRPLPASLV